MWGVRWACAALSTKLTAAPPSKRRSPLLPRALPRRAQVATHRETGASRGYAFVSYDSTESAEGAIKGLGGVSVDGRAIRVELARADRNPAPY